MRDANFVCALDLADQLFPIFVKCTGVDFTRNEEVGNVGPALRSAFGHEAAESAEDFDIARRWRARRSTRCVWRGSRSLHVRRENLTTGSRASHSRDIHA